MGFNGFELDDDLKAVQKLIRDFTDREIRPLAVELLYEVIGTPKTFEEVLSEMDEQEDDHDE